MPVDSCREKNESHYYACVMDSGELKDAESWRFSLIKVIRVINLVHAEHLMSLQLRLPLLDLTAFKEPGIESRGRVSYMFKRHIRSDPDLSCVPSAINFLTNLKSISRQ